MKRAIAALLILVPAIAYADKSADDYYKEGSDFYVLQKWNEAIDAFKKGFELETDSSKKPAYLFNIAQSYRFAKQCKNSRFYYNQYLSAPRSKPLKEEKRREVEEHLAEIESCAKSEEAAEEKAAADAKIAAAEKAAADKAAKDKAAKDKEIASQTDPDIDDDGTPGVTKHAEPVGQPKLISARLIGGGSVLSAGSLTVPIQSNFALIGGYPKALGAKLAIELGAAFSVAPSKYQVGMDSRSAMFTTVLANAGATYWVTDKIGARGDLGVGVLALSGASESPFTNYKPTTGALGMFHVRGGVSFDYVVAPNLLITVPLAVSFSPAKSGLREDISGFTRFDFMLGVGYRM